MKNNKKIEKNNEDFLYRKEIDGKIKSEITIYQAEKNDEYTVLEAYFDDEGFLINDRFLTLKKENYNEFVDLLANSGFEIVKNNK